MKIRIHSFAFIGHRTPCSTTVTPAALSILLLAAGAIAATGAHAQNTVLLYRQGITPDPAEIAAILTQSAHAPGPERMRGVKLLADPARVPAAEPGPQLAAIAPTAADCDGRAPQLGARERGVRLLADAGATLPPDARAVVATVPAKSGCDPHAQAPSAPQAEVRPVLAAAATVPTRPVTSAQTAEPTTDAKLAARTGRPAFALPVNFEFDSARIQPEAYAQLDAAGQGIKLAGASLRIVIEGHTDGIGSARYNVMLSELRALAVRDYLVQHHGIQPERIQAVGVGMAAPLNRINRAAPENRRVEFHAEAA